MKQHFRLALFTLVSSFLLALPGIASAGLSSQEHAFLASLSTDFSLSDRSLGDTRQEKRLLKRIGQEQQKPAAKQNDLDSLCLVAGTCRRFRRYRRGRRFVNLGARARAYWFLWRGWWQLGSAYTAAFIVGLTGLTITQSNNGATVVGAFFGLMMVPVLGPLISFIIAMANIRGDVDSVWWALGGIGALATFIPQVVGLSFLIVGYLSLSRLNRARYYGNTDPNKPSWAVTPYVDPNGAGVAVFGRF